MTKIICSKIPEPGQPTPVTLSSSLVSTQLGRVGLCCDGLDCAATGLHRGLPCAGSTDCTTTAACCDGSAACRDGSAPCHDGLHCDVSVIKDAGRMHHVASGCEMSTVTFASLSMRAEIACSSCGSNESLSASLQGRLNCWNPDTW